VARSRQDIAQNCRIEPPDDGKKPGWDCNGCAGCAGCAGCTGSVRVAAAIACPK